MCARCVRDPRCGGGTHVGVVRWNPRPVLRVGPFALLTPRPTGRNSFMSLHGLLDVVVTDPALSEAVKAATGGHRTHVDLVGPPAARPFTVAALAREAGRTVLAVTATGREAEDL